jgi:hypothetical protein
MLRDYLQRDDEDKQTECDAVNGIELEVGRAEKHDAERDQE